MFREVFQIILYLLVITLPAWLVTWFGGPGGGVLTDWGRNFALIGFMILVLQFLIATRIKWLEQVFGFDILIRFHKYMALAALVFLALHPVFLALGGSGWKLLFSLDLPWYILAGKAALFLLVLNALLSSYQQKIKLKFERWRLAHDILALTILMLIFLHSWIAGQDLGLWFMQLLWAGLLLLAIYLFIHQRFIRPQKLRKQAYQVQEVIQEAEKVWTIKMVPPQGLDIAAYLPGQFHFLTFFRDSKLPREEHHFTISSSPAQRDYISSTIKEVGDFTSTIGRTKAGDKVAVHGPFGRFSHVLHPKESDLVFLAGGIGITPLMSMLRHMRDTQDTRSVVLLYANRRENQIIFRKELDKIASGSWPNLNLVYVLSRPEKDWTGEAGHINREMIEKYCGQNPKRKTFYVCGPQKMAGALIHSLQEMGVQDKRIRQEIFSFLD